MVDPVSVRAAVSAAGFVIEDFVDLPHLPSPMAVWRPLILASTTPAMRIRDDAADHDRQVDRAWSDLSARNGTLGSSGTVLLSVEGGGSLPWLRARVRDQLPRASAIGLPEHVNGFVALSLDGNASSGVSTEEWETWIFADPHL
ncbi:hypothetical protein [Couchioplanes azureus]|uniref:hypothetical protein n=1 Tax=Couchioplanes caeruleus TaxID=56438 RepID=UPI001671472E|nr:hypothetical protein [Couchioplanes caeruleus]GGQ56269.1 hypothetical protein GCM10010166_27160 [Couchioplanes caeruleus subsp. azureus]